MKLKEAKRIIENPAKAGVMLYEDVDVGQPQPRRDVLVPYNEGRFSKAGPFLILPKGSVDIGESPIRAAIRETSEETGFPLDVFLGEENIVKLESGDRLFDITNNEFPGVTLRDANPRAYPHEYHSRSGNTQTMVMYGFKMEGLKNIPKLKNHENRTTKMHLDANPSIPRFPKFFKWMCEGCIPATEGAAAIPLCDPKWFAQMMRNHAPNGNVMVEEYWHQTRANWQAFCLSMEPVDDKDVQAIEDYKTLRDCFAKIKSHLLQQGCIQGDLGTFKFDEKDCPLFYYTEGAVVKPLRDVLVQTLRDMESCADYAHSFGGRGTKLEGLSQYQMAALGQVAGYAAFARDRDWNFAMREAYGSNKGADAMIKKAHAIIAGAAVTGRSK